MPIYRGEGGSGESSTNALANEVAQDAADAANSASQAAASATSAANSATAAANSATAAAASETAAETAETNAETAETNAAASATAAATSETNAATSETNAATSETNAATSASNASTSETNAANSATAAATSASNASTSETNAATSATNAATSETNAANSATAAATSASNAATSETNAANSATAAANSYDDFDDRYLGDKASDPSVDNDGDALLTGALYFNTTSNAMKVYTGSAWNEISDTLDSLTDVTITSASNGQVLKYNGSAWVNSADAGGIALTDLSVTTNAAGTAALSYNNITGVFSYTPPDLSSYLTSFTETNDLTVAVTWANVPDANITQSSVTQHQAALSITESQISDLGTYLSSGDTAASLTITSADINGGTIDGTTIGGTTAAAGTFTTFTSTGIDDNATSSKLIVQDTYTKINGTQNRSAALISTQTRSSLSFKASGTTNDFTVAIGAVGDNMVFSTPASGVYAERMRIDSSGNMVFGTSSSSTTPYFAFKTSGAHVSGTSVGIRGEADGLVFGTGITATPNERMRIDSTGNVGINKTAPENKLHVYQSGYSPTTNDDACIKVEGNWGGGIVFAENTNRTHIYSPSGQYLKVRTNSTASGGGTDAFMINASGDVHADGNVVAYSTSLSDIRMKDDIQTITGALDTIDALRGVTFTWKDGSREGKRDYGLIAQEVEKIVPEVVHETTLPLLKGDDDKTLYKTVDYDKLISVLVQAVSELRAEVKELKNGSA